MPNVSNKFATIYRHGRYVNTVPNRKQALVTWFKNNLICESKEESDAIESNLLETVNRRDYQIVLHKTFEQAANCPAFLK